MTLTLDPLDIAGTVLPAPDITQLTTNSVDGTGVYDSLMRVTKLHLQEEYDAGRITGEEYSTVYLGSLTAVLQQSVSYLLNHQNAEKVLAEIGLLRQKTVTELAQTDDDLPIGLGFNGDSLVEGMIKSQIDLNALQQDLVTSQVEQSETEVVLTKQKVITELAQTDDNISAAAAVFALNGGLDILGLIKAQHDQIDSTTELTTQKLVTELSQTSDTKPIDLGQMATIEIDGMAKSQREKIDSEVVLLSQKSITELAQTSDAVVIGTSALNTVTVVTGVTAKQKDLFQAQTDGFARDAEQKAAKILVDSWSVSATVSEATANSDNELDDVSVGAVVNVLKAGIGVA